MLIIKGGINMKVELTREEYNDIVELVRSLDDPEVTKIFNACFSKEKHASVCSPSVTKDKNGEPLVRVDISTRATSKLMSVLIQHGSALHKAFAGINQQQGKSTSSWLAFIAKNASAWGKCVNQLAADLVDAFKREDF